MNRKPDPLYASGAIVGPKDSPIGSTWRYLLVTADGKGATREQRGASMFGYHLVK
jgi:hypothetical protein